MRHLGAFAAFAWLLAAASADAAGLLEERYDISIAGIEIGDAALRIDRTDADYVARLTGDFRFLFWSGTADLKSAGAAAGVGFAPRAYDSLIVSPSRSFRTSIAFHETGARSDWRAEPPLEEEQDVPRVPLRDADLIGAKDILSAFVISARTGEAACGRTLKVFSGVVRFDLDLSPVGATGGLVDCVARYRPLSGHRLDGDGAARLRRDGVKLSVFEIAPGLWAPHRVGLTTAFGTLALTRRVD